jgi:hypothetical protein
MVTIWKMRLYKFIWWRKVGLIPVTIRLAGINTKVHVVFLISVKWALGKLNKKMHAGSFMKKWCFWASNKRFYSLNRITARNKLCINPASQRHTYSTVFLFYSLTCSHTKGWLVNHNASRKSRLPKSWPKSTESSVEIKQATNCGVIPQKTQRVHLGAASNGLLVNHDTSHKSGTLHDCICSLHHSL